MLPSHVVSIIEHSAIALLLLLYEYDDNAIEFHFVVLKIIIFIICTFSFEKNWILFIVGRLVYLHNYFSEIKVVL